MATERLGLPYIVQSQAQKEVTHAQAMDAIDARLGVLHVPLMEGVTPAGTGADAHEFMVPFFEGVSKTFELYEVRFRQGAVASVGASAIMVQKATGGNAAFGAGTNMLGGNLSIAAGSYLATTTTVAGGGAAEVVSGNLIRVDVISIGTDGGNWMVALELKEIPA